MTADVEPTESMYSLGMTVEVPSVWYTQKHLSSASIAVDESNMNVANILLRSPIVLCLQKNLIALRFYPLKEWMDARKIVVLSIIGDKIKKKDGKSQFSAFLFVNK